MIEQRGVVARSIMSRWRPFILAHNHQAAGWLAHDLCLHPNEWRYVHDGFSLGHAQDPTVFVLENWRYQRSMEQWMEIEQVLKTHDACIVDIPPRDGLSVDAWLERVVKALDVVRVRPQFALT